MTTRRDLLTGAAALTVSAIPLATVSAEPPASGAGDAAFVAAEAKITAIHRQRDSLPDLDAPEANALWNRAWEFDDFIAETPPASAIQAAVKLRRVLDADMGLPTGIRINDVPCLAQILDYLELTGGKPTHPTRPIAREEE